MLIDFPKPRSKEANRGFKAHQEEWEVLADHDNQAINYIVHKRPAWEGSQTPEDTFGLGTT